MIVSSGFVCVLQQLLLCLFVLFAEDQGQLLDYQWPVFSLAALKVDDDQIVEVKLDCFVGAHNVQQHKEHEEQHRQYGCGQHQFQ